MKKILYSLMMLAVACFTACGSDDEGDAVSTTPAQDVAAKYEGRWAAVQTTALDDTTYYDGTLTITAQSQYVVTLNGVCTGLNFDKTANANITATASGYYFNTAASSTNDYNSVLTGYVANNQAHMTFTASQKVGRKTVGFYYIFTGDRTAQ